jgi:hypothetical protein
MKTKKTKKYPKMNRRAKEVSKRTVAEELETGKYPRRQAVAIGLSRARDEARHERAMATARKYL